MYMSDPREEAPLPPASAALTTALSACALVTLWLGILPGTVLDAASRAAVDLLR